MILTQAEEGFYEKNNINRWPLTIDDAILCLEEVPYAQDSFSIFDQAYLSEDIIEKIED